MNAEQFAAFMAALPAAAPAPRPNKKIPEFTSGLAEDWITWRKNFETIIQINGWGDVRARRELYSSISGLAKTYVEHIPIGADGPVALVQPVQALITAYDNCFVTLAAGDIARAEVRKSQQNEGEPIIAWHARARSLWVRAYPALTAAQLDANRDLIEHFLMGIANSYVRTRAWETRPMTYVAALATASNMDASRIMQESRHPSPSLGGRPSPALHAMTLPQDAQSDSSARVQAMGEASKRSLECYFCGKPGHVFRECRNMAMMQKQYHGNRGQGARARFDRPREENRPTFKPSRGARGGRGWRGGRGGRGNGRGEKKSGGPTFDQLRRISALVETAKAEAMTDAGPTAAADYSQAYGSGN